MVPYRPPEPPKKPTQHPLVMMLANRLNDIDIAFKAIFKIADKGSYTSDEFRLAATAGSFALSAAKEFLPHLTIKDSETE